MRSIVSRPGRRQRSNQGRNQLYFSSPWKLLLNEDAIPDTAPGQALAKSISSAISAGTEKMVYRGQIPMGVVSDTTIQSLLCEFGLPMKYGYAIIGEIIGAGRGVAGHWLGRKVFAFRPPPGLKVSIEREAFYLNCLKPDK
jgi:hypothetical protein